MPSYTVSKNGYGTVTGSFTWVDSNINVSLKPENLYAWTWRETTTVYTSSSTPSSGDYLYNADGTIYINDTVNVYDASSNSIYGTPSGDRYYRNLSSDLVWNSNTNQYGLAHGPVGDNLYAYTDPNVIGETLYAWTIDPEDIKNFSSEFPFSYVKDGQSFTLSDNTIYTKTPVVDTSTNVYYLVDGTELAITNIHFAFDDPYDSTGIVSADASTITINFEE